MPVPLNKQAGQRQVRIPLRIFNCDPVRRIENSTKQQGTLPQQSAVFYIGKIRGDGV
ncbi:MAG: hypothetical protein IKH57_11175 [Clostridia bacterium]|nr:hypothetical protein [Clostridia bacterium]